MPTSCYDILAAAARDYTERTYGVPVQTPPPVADREPIEFICVECGDQLIEGGLCPRCNPQLFGRSPRRADRREILNVNECF